MSELPELEWKIHFNRFGLIIQSTEDKSLKGLLINWSIGGFYIGYTRLPIVKDNNE